MDPLIKSQLLYQLSYGEERERKDMELFCPTPKPLVKTLPHPGNAKSRNPYFRKMIIIDDIVISREIFDTHFICDLPQCLGACCVEGDAGAPLEEAEIGELEDALDEVIPYMTEEGKATVKQYGVFDYDADGNYVTPLNDGKECAFTFFEEGIARCAIEQAWMDKKIDFQKPVSCHLYPIRIKKLHQGEAVNYHRWHICAPALLLGKKEGVPLYVFLKEPLIRKYGAGWYQKLEAAAKKKT